MKKIIILGAGVIGVTTAYYLARQGHQVKVIDAAAGPALVTSFANGSQLSYSKTQPLSDMETLKHLPRLIFGKNTPIHVHPGFDAAFLRWGCQFLRECLPARSKRNAQIVLDLALKSRRALHEIVNEHTVDFDYAKRGKMYVFTKKAEVERAAKGIDEYKKHGIDQRLLTADEAVSLEPALADMKALIQGVIFSSIDESGDARKFTMEMAKVCAGLGVEFVYNVKINAFRQQKNRLTAALAAETEFEFDDIIVALGPESPRLLKQLEIYLPIYPMKGYSITINAGVLAPEINITDEEKRVVYAKIGNRVRIAGVAEFAGYDYGINRKIMDAMIKVAKTRFPRAGDYSQIEEWAGLRPLTPSTVPIIGKSKKFENLYLNTGHGMLGWTLACGSAQKLAEII